MFAGQIAFEPFRHEQGLRCQLLCPAAADLHLRPLNRNDTEPLFAVITANRDHLKQWLPWLDTHRTLADSQNFIQFSRDRAEANNGFILAICSNHSIIGIVGLNYINWENQLSGLGYWLAEAHQGKGIMTIACKALIDYSFTTLKLNRLEIRCADQNHRSAAVAQRLGFTSEGRFREVEWLYDHFVDHKVYALLRRDWQS